MTDNNQEIEIDDIQKQLDDILDEVLQKTKMVYDKDDPVFALIVINHFLSQKNKENYHNFNEVFKAHLQGEFDKVAIKVNDILVKLNDKAIQDSLKHTIELSNAFGGHIAKLEGIIADYHHRNQKTKYINIGICAITAIFAGVAYYFTRKIGG